MQKILYFLLLVLSVIGLLGGIGYTVYCNAYVITIGLAVACYVIYPAIADMFNRLKE